MTAPESTGKENKPDRLIGTVLDGQLEIKEVLGYGGMGTVYLAYHHGLDQTVAIKVLHRKLLTNSDAVRRLKSEAQIAGNLNHPNLVATQKFGFVEEDLPYIQMELVSGISLSDYLATHGPLPRALFLDIFTQCAEGLLHAHERGVVHRDIKPSNIILIPVAGGGKDDKTKFDVKVADFGIAKALTGDNFMQHLTQTGDVIGTPMYMSPEQCQSQVIDHRSDIYSLGCVMYECLCGRTPFQADSPFEVMMKHANLTPSCPTKFNRDLTKDDALIHLVLKALAKSPDERYQTMRELIGALQDVQNNKYKVGSSAKRKSKRKFAGNGDKGKVVAVACIIAIGTGCTAYGINAFFSAFHKQPHSVSYDESSPDSVLEHAQAKLREHDRESAKRAFRQFMVFAFGDQSDGNNHWHVKPEFQPVFQLEKIADASRGLDKCSAEKWPDHRNWYPMLNALADTNGDGHFLFSDSLLNKLDDKATEIEQWYANSDPLEQKQENVADQLAIAGRLCEYLAHYNQSRQAFASDENEIAKLTKRADRLYLRSINNFKAQRVIHPDEVETLSVLQLEYGKFLIATGRAPDAVPVLEEAIKNDSWCTRKDPNKQKRIAELRKECSQLLSQASGSVRSVH